MRRHKHMVGAIAPIPVRHLAGNPPDGRLQQPPRVAERREAIDSAEVAGDVHRHEEEVGLARVRRPEPLAASDGLVQCHLRREEVAGAAAVRQPPGVVLRRQVVDVDFHVDGARRSRVGDGEEGGGGGRRLEEGEGGGAATAAAAIGGEVEGGGEEVEEEEELGCVAHGAWELAHGAWEDLLALLLDLGLVVVDPARSLQVGDHGWWGLEGEEVAWEGGGELSCKGCGGVEGKGGRLVLFLKLALYVAVNVTFFFQVLVFMFGGVIL